VLDRQQRDRGESERAEQGEPGRTGEPGELVDPLDLRGLELLRDRLGGIFR
jgi:hypothetical protein